MINNLRFVIAKLLGRIAFVLSRISERGSGEQIQGRVIDALCPRALRTLSKNRRIIVVSATNGKTTTTRLISSAFTQKHKNTISNALGANQRAGVIAALANWPTSNTSVDSFAILEVDERSLPGMFEEINPELLVLGNLSRDQLDRFGEVSSISHSWKKMLKGSNVKVIANGCDPHIVFAIDQLEENQIIYVEIASRWHDDAHSCPKCGELLLWDEQSHFNSPTCGFSTPKNLERVGDSLKDSIKESISLPGNWNQTNAFLAYLVCKNYDISDDLIFNSWKNVKDVSGRNAIFEIGKDSTLQLFLAKNPAGWNETLNYISQSQPDATIFAFNCNIADGKDPSWLYDVDFENSTITNVIIFGERAIDMQVRLEVAGKKVTVVKDLESAIKKCIDIKHTNVVASYTQFLNLSRTLPKTYSTNSESQ